MAGRHEIAALDAFSRYRDGFLPEAGGMLDQTAQFCAVVRVLGGLTRVHERIEMDRVKHGS